jgi:hypothetical protein
MQYCYSIWWTLWTTETCRFLDTVLEIKVKIQSHLVGYIFIHIEIGCMEPWAKKIIRYMLWGVLLGGLYSDISVIFQYLNYWLYSRRLYHMYRWGLECICGSVNIRYRIVPSSSQLTWQVYRKTSPYITANYTNCDAIHFFKICIWHNKYIEVIILYFKINHSSLYVRHRRCVF